MIQVFWSEEDNEYVAIEPKRYASLSVLDPDPAAAREGLRLLIEGIENGVY